jgi:hypothetical protein
MAKIRPTSFLPTVTSESSPSVLLSVSANHLRQMHTLLTCIFAAPYPGFPLDPPFRSRFQSRYLDPLVTSQILAKSVTPTDSSAADIVQKTSNAISAIQVMKEMREYSAPFCEL